LATRRKESENAITRYSHGGKRDFTGYFNNTTTARIQLEASKIARDGIGLHIDVQIEFQSHLSTCLLSGTG